MDAVGVRLRAIGEHVPQLRKLGVAVLFDEAGDDIAAAATAGLALDGQGGDEEVREGVGVITHCRQGTDRRFARATTRGLTPFHIAQSTLIADPRGMAQKPANSLGCC
jgi:hypothetical protein